MAKTIIIAPCSGACIDVKAGQLITIRDVSGGQVVDFFAQSIDDPEDFLSTGVTIDCNESLKLHVGDTLHTAKYRRMFELIADDVKAHDLIHPCCRKEMYDFFYHNGAGHQNCLDNINSALNKRHPIIHPVNFFMNTQILPNGRISVEKPLSKAGDCVVLKALMDVRLGVAACSVSESDCNAGGCTEIEITIE